MHSIDVVESYRVVLASISTTRALTSNVGALMHAICVVVCVYHSTKFGFVHIWDSTCSVRSYFNPSKDDIDNAVIFNALILVYFHLGTKLWLVSYNHLAFVFGTPCCGAEKLPTTFYRGAWWAYKLTVTYFLLGH